MVEAHGRHPLRILAYCVRSNHWHFVVWPRADREATDDVPPAGEHPRDAPAGGAARTQAGDPTRAILSDWPIERPADWVDRVNSPLSSRERKRLRRSLDRGQPFGEDAWADRTARRLGLEHTLRREGRPPRKN